MEPDPEVANEYADLMNKPDDEKPVDDNEAEQQEADMADLFGDDEPTLQPTDQPDTDATLNQDTSTQPYAALGGYTDDYLEYPDIQEPLSPNAQAQALAASMPQVEAEIMLVNLPQPAPSTSASHQPLWHTKLPSFLRVESNAFDEGSFDPEREEQLGPVSVESVLRWRWAEDASVKQSNSRILQWSDGSKSLQVGSELFDVVTQPAPTSTGSTYLAASHDYATLQEIQARVSGHMTFVPSAVGSQTHKKLASGVTQRHVKTARTQSIAIAKDPMAQLAEDQAAEAARLRAQKKKSRKSGLGGGAGGSDSEGDATLWGRGRGPARYAYDSDEDDGGFVVDDDGEEGGDDALDMAEKAFNRRKEIDFDDDDDEDDEEMGDTGDGAATGSSGPAKIEKKRMVVEGSDEE